MKVLVIEDSERLRKSLRKGLSSEGFITDVAADGEAGLDMAIMGSYDVIVLDLMLPIRDGISVLKEILRNRVRSCVLILSAKDQISERVDGLEIGADDYLSKPFAFAELCVRIKTLGRRKYGLQSHSIEIGDLALNTSQMNVRYKNQIIPLTKTEYQILETLALRKGRVVSKNELFTSIREHEEIPESNIVEAMVSTLRKKLIAVHESNREIINTKRGFGYIIY